MNRSWSVKAHLDVLKITAPKGFADYLKLLKSTFAVQSLANFFSVGFLGICGLLLNFIIAREYSPAALGIFCQVFSVYILFSQLGTLGVNYSVLKYIPEYPELNNTRTSILSSALVVVLLFSSFSTLLLYLFTGLIGRLLDSPETSIGIIWVLPGLWCYSFNKLLMNAINGAQEMIAFAVFSCLRYVLMLAALLAMVHFRAPGHILSFLLSVAEILLLFSLLVYTRAMINWRFISRLWIKKHISFGTRGIIAGILIELNTKIDILVLGYYTDTWATGLYGFAATICEGINQIPYVFRRMLDPKLSILFLDKRIDEIKSLAFRAKLFMSAGMFFISLISIAFFPYIVRIATHKPEFMASFPVFIILLAGVVLQSGYIPLSGILVQGGYPGVNTALISLTAISNLILNVLLIPHYGIEGAAIATSVSFILYVVYLKIMVRLTYKCAI